MTTETGPQVGVWGILGVVFSLLLIIVPLALFVRGYWPSFMLGATIGATLRFVTDIVVSFRKYKSDAGDIERFISNNMLLTAAVILFQIGSLGIGLGLFVLTGSLFAIGYVSGILAGYMFSIVQTMFTEDPLHAQSDDADNEDEWTFDVDDV